CDGDEKEILFALNEAVLGNMDETGAGCQADSDCSADKPYCDTATGVCKGCVQDSHCPTDLPYCNTDRGICHECNSNDDCDDGYFCADSNESSNAAHPDTCKPLNFSGIDLTNEEGVTETWHYSNEPMTWWDTQQACAAMNLRMPIWEEIASGFQGEWTGYSIIRPHVKTLYKLLTKSSTMTDRPFFPISDWRYLVLSDGFMPNWGGSLKNTNDGSDYIVFGVCKK
ncbi:MAG: hypothetical protein IKY98_03735, partial [Alphaproteobacteria bacterium]|nr:hypothetical protein [Alphaproteobacteria bacterium]